jgi:prophage regulatory protein
MRGVAMVVRILRLKVLKEATGLSRSSIYEQMANDDFPKPIPLGPRAVGWVESEVLAWQRKRIAKRDAEASRKGSGKKEAAVHRPCLPDPGRTAVYREQKRPSQAGAKVEKQKPTLREPPRRNLLRGAPRNLGLARSRTREWGAL